MWRNYQGYIVKAGNSKNEIKSNLHKYPSFNQIKSNTDVDLTKDKLGFDSKAPSAIVIIN